jgi:uncharacterized protein
MLYGWPLTGDSGFGSNQSVPGAPAAGSWKTSRPGWEPRYWPQHRSCGRGRPSPHVGHNVSVDTAPHDRLWLHEHIAVRESAIEGNGLFATADLPSGVIVIRLAGRLVSAEELAGLIDQVNGDPLAPYVDTLTVDEDSHLVLPSGSAVHFGNHSCDPNLWHVGPYDIATRRPVGIGEELTIDYGTQSGAPGFSMTCHCGSPGCRLVVSSEDWRLPALQERYQDHWVPALQVRISAL